MNIYTRFYNILANVIRCIEDNTKDEFYIKYRGMNVNQRAKIKKELWTAFPELVQKETCQPLEIIDDERWDEEFFGRLEEFIDKCKEEKEGKKLLVCLLHKIDTGLSERILSGSDYLNTSELVNCLNTNEPENGIMLLPRCQCLWERNSHGRQYGYGLMNEMKSLYYVRKEDLKGYQLKNIFLNKTLFPEFESLKIGVSPITNKDILCVSYHEKDNTVYFSIDKLKKISDIRKKVGNIINNAKEAGVNILLFPEMAGMEALQEDYKDLYQKEWDDNYPQLIIFPSIWSNHTNTCTIVGMDGTQIGCQQKQNPYTFPINDKGTEAIEDLEPDNKILLFHIEGIGRMAIMICKDFLHKNYRRIILDSLKGTLLAVPSFSTGSFDFEQVMFECCQYDCGVIWCNCCSAMNLPNAKQKNFRNIGYIQFSGKLTDSVGKISIEEKKPCSKKRCKKDCLFINEIMLNI